VSSFCLKATITANTVAKRDNIYDTIETFLSGKPVWGDTVMTKGADMVSGQPNMSITVRFTRRPNLDNLFAQAKAKILTLTGVSIKISKHICHHDEGSNQPCVPEEMFEIVR